MGVARTTKEIEDVHNEAVVQAEEPTRYPGMTYEQGVLDTLEWLTNSVADNPTD